MCVHRYTDQYLWGCTVRTCTCTCSYMCTFWNVDSVSKCTIYMYMYICALNMLKEAPIQFEHRMTGWVIETSINHPVFTCQMNIHTCVHVSGEFHLTWHLEHLHVHHVHVVFYVYMYMPHLTHRFCILIGWEHVTLRWLFLLQKDYRPISFSPFSVALYFGCMVALWNSAITG